MPPRSAVASSASAAPASAEPQPDEGPPGSGAAMPPTFPASRRRGRTSRSPSPAASGPSPFEGLWESEVEQLVRMERLGTIHLEGTRAYFRNGSVLVLTTLPPTECTLRAPVGSGVAHRGSLRADGKSEWVDGDVWIRVAVAREEPATEGIARVKGREPGNRATNAGDGPIS